MVENKIYSRFKFELWLMLVVKQEENLSVNVTQFLQLGWEQVHTEHSDRCERVWRRRGEREAAVTSSMTSLMDQWRSEEAEPGRGTQTFMSQPTAPWLLLGTRMKSSERLSDTVAEAPGFLLGSSWVPPGFLLGFTWVPPGFLLVHWCHWLTLMFLWPKSSWTPIGRHVSVHLTPPSPSTVQEEMIQVWEEMIQVWEENPQDSILLLLRSIMSRCCQENTQAGGGHTHWVTWWLDEVHTSWISLWFQFVTGTFSVVLNPVHSGLMVLVPIGRCYVFLLWTNKPCCSVEMFWLSRCVRCDEVLPSCSCAVFQWQAVEACQSPELS